MDLKIIGYCREGFEPESVAELQALGFSAERGGPAWVRAQTSPGRFRLKDIPKSAHSVGAGIFLRQVIIAQQIITGDSEAGISSMVATAKDLLALLSGANAFSAFWLESPDSNDGKAETKALGRMPSRFERALNIAKLLPKGPGAADLPRLHLFVANPSLVYLGLSQPGPSAAWPMGVPRLRLPKGAPSRATLKLDEAFQVFLDKAEREQFLKEGLRAVDLGAAPGGWTFQMVRRGIFTYAVDNANMDASLLESGLVEHVRADAFSWLPPEAVDWLVCDVVEQPRQIASLMSRWAQRGLARRMIFNLKLPMKQRWAELQADLKLLETSVGKNQGYRLVAKQLFHDRKEVTVYLGPQ